MAENPNASRRLMAYADGARSRWTGMDVTMSVYSGAELLCAWRRGWRDMRDAMESDGLLPALPPPTCPATPAVVSESDTRACACEGART